MLIVNNEPKLYLGEWLDERFTEQRLANGTTKG